MMNERKKKRLRALRKSFNRDPKGSASNRRGPDAVCSRARRWLAVKRKMYQHKHLDRKLPPLFEE